MTALAVDVTALLLTGLRTQLGIGVRFGTETPKDLETAGPIVQVVRAGGGDDGIILDTATIVLDCFAAKSATEPASVVSRELAYSVVAAMYALRGQVINGGVITRVQKIGGPVPLPYDNVAVRRQALTFQVAVKSV